MEYECQLCHKTLPHIDVALCYDCGRVACRCKKGYRGLFKLFCAGIDTTQLSFRDGCGKFISGHFCCRECYMKSKT